MCNVTLEKCNTELPLVTFRLRFGHPDIIVLAFHFQKVPSSIQFLSHIYLVFKIKIWLVLIERSAAKGPNLSVSGEPNSEGMGNVLT